jgi:predicted nucleic acid-binding protein
MAAGRLRVGLDANILIAGVRLPRWPYEVMRAAVSGSFDLVLPEQVVIEARRHLQGDAHRAALEAFLAGATYDEVTMPPARLVFENRDLVRSEKDVPIALALLDGEADIFVTNDRDFTDPGATAERFQRRVRVMLAAVFLRDVLGWSPEALEAVRGRSWEGVLRETQGHTEDA